MKVYLSVLVNGVRRLIPLKGKLSPGRKDFTNEPMLDDKTKYAVEEK